MDQEITKKIECASSPEEILEIAEKNDINMKKEEAEKIFNYIHASGEISDDELDAVSGGVISLPEWSHEAAKRVCPKCGKKASSWGIYAFVTKFYCEDCDYRWSEENPWLEQFSWFIKNG